MWRARVEIKDDLVVHSQDKKIVISPNSKVTYSRRDKDRSMKVQKLESADVQFL